MLRELIELHKAAVSLNKASFKRYLFNEIDWSQKLIAIVGMRGVGKTTMMIQLYQEKFRDPEECLYLSADNAYVLGRGLFNIAHEFHKERGKILLVDEIHKYPNWSQELKNIYDTFPMKVVISGSSTLDLIKGKYDLSRRILVYQLKNLSFREFLNLKTGLDFKKLTMKDIIGRHVKLAMKMPSDISILKLFREYLRSGAYPYYFQDEKGYLQRVHHAVEKVIYEDIPAVFKLNQDTLPILMKIIYLVATSQPFVPNTARLSREVGVSRQYVDLYLSYLEKANIFSFLSSPARGFRLMRKPQKIYMENPNLIYALTEFDRLPQEIGAIRESFFINQLRFNHKVTSHPKTDFLVDDRFVFEIGGKNKGRGQLKGERNAYVVADNIESGFGRTIPLWLFGMLY